MKLASIAILCVAVLPAQQPEPLRVCATTPDLGSLAKIVGGDLVEVTTFVQGPEDPHFLEARPSMIKATSKADALLEVGLELEVGYLPLCTDNARNAAVLLGAPGRIDASTVIEKLEVPQGTVDRSRGDVHPGGNPHFFSDPLCGLLVAAQLRDRFTALRPGAKAAFAGNYDRFRQQLCEAMVGQALAKLYAYDVEKLGVLFGRGRLADVLKAQGDLDKLQGWFGLMLPYRGSKIVADHDLWPYFAERFGVQVIGFFEPKPGISPTTAHLELLIQRMRAENVRVILSVPYFAPQHAEFVARATGAQIAEMAHQVGSRPGCDDYIKFVDHNVHVLAGALAGKGQ
ncbi:MAG TPA: metal ABC transporter substrate-binding protein [Planctomycetota bacterium]|nr:metal ABC transporter substrate-binding protein [Planctomycetota bacterium]